MTRSTGGPGGAGSGAEIDHPGTARSRLGARHGRHACLPGGGAEFGYHGDFDWGGVRIANAVRHRVTWRPWRYDHVAYQAAVSAAHPLAALGGLVGEPAATPWDPALATAMRHVNLRVEEELTLDDLLQDLSP